MRYSSDVKAAVLKKILGPGGRSVSAVSAEMGLIPRTVYGWLREAQDGAVSRKKKKSGKGPDINEKFSLILEARGLSEDDLGPWLRAKGLHVDVSRSGFYEWLSRGDSPRAAQDRELTREIERSFEESRGVYGTPRIIDDLRDWGFRVGKNRIDRLKRAAGIFARVLRRFRVQTTDSRHDLKASPNLIGRDFSVIAPNCVWTSDITYVRLVSGAFAYVCVVMDLFSREIVGWSAEMHMRVDLVTSAMRSALKKRGPCAGLM